MRDKYKITGFQLHHHSQTGVGAGLNDRLATLHIKSSAKGMPDTITLKRSHNDDTAFYFYFDGNRLSGHNSLGYDPTIFDNNVGPIILILDHYYIADFNVLLEIQAFVRKCRKIINDRIIRLFLEQVDRFKISDGEIMASMDVHVVERIMTE